MISFDYQGKHYSNFSKVDAISLGIPSEVYNSEFFKSKIKNKLADIKSNCQLELNALTVTYPQGEVSTFDKQETESVAFLADNTAATPLIDALAASREIDKTELANRVVAKAGLFSAASGAIIGKRQKLEDTLNALSEENNTIEDIAAIAW